MKKQILRVSTVFLVSTSIFVFSCRKHDSPTPETTTTDSPTQQSNDQSRIGDAVNSVSDDANSAAQSTTSLGGRVEGNIACDVTISNITSDSLGKTLTYTGQCSGTKYTRTGSVTVQLIPASVGKKWKDQGSKLVITYNNVKVTRKSDGNSITLNGTMTHWNVSGGTIYSLASAPNGTVKHKIKGTLTASFSDTTTSTATWNINKTRTWNSSGSGLTYTVQGDSTYSNYNNVSDIGVNRRGKPFIVVNNGITIANCGTANAPVYKALGTEINYFNSGTLTIKYGTDSNGNLATAACDGQGYYFTWSRPLFNESKNLFISY